MFKNPTLAIVALVMLVNALAYGIIIPLLYPYASRFGIDPFGLSLLFVSFSIAQFFATPVIGRLSDRFGRKPLLLWCVAGTGLSLVMFALATNIWLLFISRIIDGVTGGNLAVAQAMIADSTQGKERAKAFGILGAAFGFGFLAGPALGGLLSQISLTAPFWFAAALAFLATILGVIFLKETLTKTHQAEVKREHLFNFKALFDALLKPLTGIILAVGFLTALALNAFIIGFQSFTVDVLKLPATQIGLTFALFGLVSVVMQAGGLRVVLKKVSSKRNILLVSLFSSAVILVLVSLTRTVETFVIVLFFHMVVSSFQQPITTALLSERTKAEDQGILLGINQSYVSLGQIAGPLLAGLVAVRSVPAIFALSAGLFLVAGLAAMKIKDRVTQQVDV